MGNPVGERAAAPRKVVCGPRSLELVHHAVQGCQRAPHLTCKGERPRFQNEKGPASRWREAPGQFAHMLVGVLAERTRKPSHPAIDDWLNALTRARQVAALIRLHRLTAGVLVLGKEKKPDDLGGASGLKRRVRSSWGRTPNLSAQDVNGWLSRTPPAAVRPVRSEGSYLTHAQPRLNRR